MACFYFLASFIITFCLAAGSTPKYVLKGTENHLKPVIPGQPQSILWKHNGNKVVDFDGKEQQVYEAFEHRITLDWITAELEITDLKFEDSGVYELEVDIANKLHSSLFELKVIDKVAMPTITCEIHKDSSSDVSEVQATLLCSAELTSPESLMKFEWTSSRGTSQPGHKMNISVGDEQANEEYICSVSNPVSSETTTFTAKDCFPEEDSSVALAVSLTVIGLFVLVLSIIFCKVRQKACFAKDDEEKPLSAEGSDQRVENKPLLHGEDTTLPKGKGVKELVADFEAQAMNPPKSPPGELKHLKDQKMQSDMDPDQSEPSDSGENKTNPAGVRNTKDTHRKSTPVQPVPSSASLKDETSLDENSPDVHPKVTDVEQQKGSDSEEVNEDPQEKTADHTDPSGSDEDEAQRDEKSPLPVTAEKLPESEKEPEKNHVEGAEASSAPPTDPTSPATANVSPPVTESPPGVDHLHPTEDHKKGSEPQEVKNNPQEETVSHTDPSDKNQVEGEKVSSPVLAQDNKTNQNESSTDDGGDKDSEEETPASPTSLFDGSSSTSLHTNRGDPDVGLIKPSEETEEAERVGLLDRSGDAAHAPEQSGSDQRGENKPLLHREETLPSDQRLDYSVPENTMLHKGSVKEKRAFFERPASQAMNPPKSPPGELKHLKDQKMKSDMDPEQIRDSVDEEVSQFGENKTDPAGVRNTKDTHQKSTPVQPVPSSPPSKDETSPDATLSPPATESPSDVHPKVTDGEQQKGSEPQQVTENPQKEAVSHTGPSDKNQVEGEKVSSPVLAQDNKMNQNESSTDDGGDKDSKEAPVEDTKPPEGFVKEKVEKIEGKDKKRLQTPSEGIPETPASPTSPSLHTTRGDPDGDQIKPSEETEEAEQSEPEKNQLEGEKASSDPPTDRTSTVANVSSPATESSPDVDLKVADGDQKKGSDTEEVNKNPQEKTGSHTDPSGTQQNRNESDKSSVNKSSSVSHEEDSNTSKEQDSNTPKKEESAGEVKQVSQAEKESDSMSNGDKPSNQRGEETGNTDTEKSADTPQADSDQHTEGRSRRQSDNTTAEVDKGEGENVEDKKEEECGPKEKKRDNESPSEGEDKLRDEGVD